VSRRRAIAALATERGDWSLTTSVGSGCVRPAVPGSTPGHAGRLPRSAGINLRSPVGVSDGQLVSAQSFATHG
jgi:hypothetical protein